MGTNKRYEIWRKIDTNTEPSPDETLYGYSIRIAKMARSTRQQYQEIHCKVHYCHYGAQPCYICPLWDALESISDCGIETSNILKKLAKKEFVYIAPQDKIGKWQLKPLR